MSDAILTKQMIENWGEGDITRAFAVFEHLFTREWLKLFLSRHWALMPLTQRPRKVAP